MSIGAWPWVATMLTGAWTVVNTAISDIRPAWSFVGGALGALLIAALAESLSPAYKSWKRWSIYGGLFILNAILLSGAMLGVEEVAEQGVGDAAD